MSGSPLTLKNPPAVKPHQKFTHSETYSRSVGDRVKQQYCIELDALIDCIDILQKELSMMRDQASEIREEPYSSMPMDGELSIFNEARRIEKHLSRLQLMHTVGVNTGARPTNSKHKSGRQGSWDRNTRFLRG